MGVFTVQNPGIGIHQLTQNEETFLTNFANLSYSEGQVLTIVSGVPAWATGGGGGGGTWGSITGTLSDQTDLQTALNAKQNAITGSDTRVLYFDGANNPAGDGNFTWDKTNKLLIFASSSAVQFGTSSPAMLTGSSGAGGSISLKANNSNNSLLYIAGSGFCGINTDTPSQNLTVKGTFGIRDATSAITAIFSTSSLASTNKTFAFPNISGTFALTSDLTGYVPYTGNISNVDIGHFAYIGDALRAFDTAGVLIESANGTDIGLLGAANTANVVWYGAHNFSAATQDTLAAFVGAGKTLSSLALATYPSLTEISYVKGVTSSIQTQLNGKQASGSYGLTTSPLSQFAATTSAQLAGVISDETGTGALVFGTSPEFTTSVTTASTSFTAWAGATTLLTIGGTGASASMFAPSTLDATSSITGAIRTSGGVSAAKAIFAGTAITSTTGLRIAANDGGAIGAAGTAFSDLFLAEGGVINWDSGDITLTQTGNLLDLAGGDLQLGGTGYLKIPKGTNAEEAAITSPATGMIRFNTSNNSLTFYDGALWAATATTAQVTAAIAALPASLNGQDSATISNETNCSSSSWTGGQYHGVANTGGFTIVTVSGIFNTTASAAGAASFELSTPIAGTFSNIYDGAGTAVSASGESAQITAKGSGSQNMLVSWVAIDLTAQDWTFTYTFLKS